MPARLGILRTLTLIAAFTLAIGFGFGPGANADESSAWKTIPSTTCQGLWIVPLQYDGKPGGTLRMVLDTGASSTSVDPDAIRRVFGKKVRPRKKVRLKNLHAGPLKIHSLRTHTHHLDHLSRALGSKIDGILGFPVFEDLLLALDYSAGEIRVAQGALPAIDNKTVFRDVGTLRPFLTLKLDGKTIPILIDSGSTGALTLRESDSLPWAVEPRPLTASVGYNEIRLERTGRAAEDYAFGPSILEQPMIDLRKDGTRLAGFRVLRHSEWIFDTRQRRIRITPNSTTNITSEPYRGPGIGVRPVETGFEVIKVFPNTPAAKADLRKGDVLTALDGVPILERGCRSLSKYSGPGDMRLTVSRGGEEFEVAVSVDVLVP